MAAQAHREPSERQADNPRPVLDADTPTLLGPRGDIDALDGTPNAQRVRLALGDVCWEVMLAEHHVDEITAFLRPFTVHAHRVAGAHYPGLADPVRLRSTQAEQVPPPRFNAPTIRAWARSQGMDVPPRGRIPAAIKAAYLTAVGNTCSPGAPAEPAEPRRARRQRPAGAPISPHPDKPANEG